MKKLHHDTLAKPINTSRPGHPALAHIFDKVDQVLNTFDTAFARWFNVFTILLIIISTIVFVVDTLEFFAPYTNILNQMEAVIAIIFSVEYLLRFWVAPKPKYKYVISLMGATDLLAILPFYFGFLPLGFLRTFRLLRMLRVLRVLRLLKFTRTITHKLTKAEKEANAFKIELQILGIAFVCIWLIFAGIMYAIESGAGTKGYENVLASMWYVIVTITTVGYGDVYPGTALGKAVAALIMLSGIGMLGTLTSIIGKQMMAKLAINQKMLEAEEGTEEEEKEEAPTQTRLYCPNHVCGETNHMLDAVFCKTCGHKVKEKK